jgi:hypothetical protein
VLVRPSLYHGFLLSLWHAVLANGQIFVIEANGAIECTLRYLLVYTRNASLPPAPDLRSHNMAS